MGYTDNIVIGEIDVKYREKSDAKELEEIDELEAWTEEDFKDFDAWIDETYEEME